MTTRLVIIFSAMLISACGAQDPKEPNHASSHSSLSSSSSNSSAEYLACSVCDVNGITGRLTVVSKQHYQAKIADLLNVPLLHSGPDFPVSDAYSHRIEAHTGQVIFVDDEYMAQRISLTLEVFYRTAEMIAENYRAVDCSNLSLKQCNDLFVTEFVEPLYERSLTDAERGAYLELFKLTGDAVDDGQKGAIIAALSSPHFLFRKEKISE